MSQKTSIKLNWDKAGKINYQISGVSLPPPRNDKLLWVLAPSAPLLLSHQYGSMKPSHGLITSSWIIDMLFDNKYVLMPINSALKGGGIDFIYTGGPSLKVQFHPKHGFFANSDSVEEGVRQLINNYFHSVYSILDVYSRIAVKSITIWAIAMYFIFIEENIKSGTIGKGKDSWSPVFPSVSADIIRYVSERYYVPDKHSENEEWARKQTEALEDNKLKLRSERNSLFTTMGLY
jgi:hypothetical protein